jgi:hypothetical protein
MHLPFERRDRKNDRVRDLEPECTLADVNGDDRSDLVAFLKDTVPGEQGYVRVALASTTAGFPVSF